MELVKLNLNGVWISLNNSYTSLFHLKALGFSAVCPSVMFVKFVDDVTLVDEDVYQLNTNCGQSKAIMAVL